MNVVIPGRRAMQSVFLVFQVKTQWSTPMQADNLPTQIHLFNQYSKHTEEAGELWLKNPLLVHRYFIKELRISLGFQNSSTTHEKWCYELSLRKITP